MAYEPLGMSAVGNPGSTAPVSASRRARVVLVSCCACVVLSLVVCARIALAVTSVRGALWSVLALLGGWLAADFVGAVSPVPWAMDSHGSRGPKSSS